MRTFSSADWLHTCEAAAREHGYARARRIIQTVWPGDDVDADPAGLRNHRLLALQRLLFGRHLACVVTCSACETLLDVTIDTDEMASRPQEMRDPVHVRYDDADFAFHLPTQRDVAAALAEGMERAPARLACACFIAGDADRLDEPGLLDALSGALEEADPFGHLAIALNCPQCAAASQAALDLAALLWSQLNEMSARLLREVHVLASAYGWSESAILGLSPARRRRYIGMSAA